jgi:SAM-dependent methyltransferase
VNYRLAYRIGFHPWEDVEDDPAFNETAAALFARAEEGRKPPFGQALDLGCGSGIWGVKLAQRGWQVTGVDIVEKALERARERVREAGVEMRVMRGDVTDLRGSGVGDGYRLLLDTGTFHDFDEEQRTAMGREVTAVAAPGATLLMLVWPRRRRPLIRGADREEVEAAFPGWEIAEVTPSGFPLPKPLELLLRPDEHWYRLQQA